MLSRVLPRDQGSELRELDKGQAARWFAGPPEVRIPIRIVRGMISKRQPGAVELALEQESGTALVITTGDVDRRTAAGRIPELCDPLRVPFAPRHRALHHQLL